MRNAMLTPIARAVSRAAANYSHVNLYKHTPIAQFGDASSESRQRRIWEFGASAPLLAILSDEQNASYPIYRTVTPEDRGKTVATLFVDVWRGVAEVYVGRPSESAPVLSFRFRELWSS